VSCASEWTHEQAYIDNVIFTFELQKRLTAAGHDTIANTSHPGLVIGPLQARCFRAAHHGQV